MEVVAVISELKLINSVINSDAAKSWIHLLPLCLCDILLFFWVISSNKFQERNQSRFRPPEVQDIQPSWSCCSWRSRCRNLEKDSASAHWMEKHCSSFMFINEKVVSFTILLDVIQVWLEFKFQYFPVTLKGTTGWNPLMEFQTVNNWTCRKVCCHTWVGVKAQRPRSRLYSFYPLELLWIGSTFVAPRRGFFTSVCWWRTGMFLHLLEDGTLRGSGWGAESCCCCWAQLLSRSCESSGSHGARWAWWFSLRASHSAQGRFFRSYKYDFFVSSFNFFFLLKIECGPVSLADLRVVEGWWRAPGWEPALVLLPTPVHPQAQFGWQTHLTQVAAGRCGRIQ